MKAGFPGLDRITERMPPDSLPRGILFRLPIGIHFSQPPTGKPSRSIRPNPVLRIACT